MNIIFFGSDDFALENLKTLCASQHKVLSLVTQPDKPKGRHMALEAPLIKQFAAMKKIPVLQPQNLKDKSFLSKLKEFDAAIFVVIAYGKFLPKEVLEIPKIFAINVHGSLLPKYRGAAPINWAVINGDKKTGISIIKIDSRMDAGDIITQKEMNIEEADTSITLRERMAKLSAAVLLETLEEIESEKFSLKKQNENDVTFAPKLEKKHGELEWARKAGEIFRQVRGLQPWPGTFAYYKGKALKILEAEISNHPNGKFRPGEVVEILKDGFVVAAGEGTLKILRVHLESSKPMDAKSFIAGHRLGVGFKFDG